jgi:hypothetical protein
MKAGWPAARRGATPGDRAALLLLLGVFIGRSHYGKSCCLPADLKLEARARVIL